MPIADTPAEAMVLTFYMVGSMIMMFFLGVYLERRKNKMEMKKI